MRSPSPSALRCALGIALLACALPAPALATRVRATALVSVDVAGDGSGNGGSSGRAATRNDATAVTPDGRYIAFTSTATDLVDPPTAAGTGVYWRDERTGHTTLVAASGADPAISADGRYVAFESTHLNGFTDNNTTGGYDVFVRDTQGGTTALVSHQAGAATAGGVGSSRYPVISGDGSTIVYQYDQDVSAIVSGATDGNSAADLLAYSRAAGTNALVTANAGGTDTQSGGAPAYFALSRDGRYLAYETAATPNTVVTGLTDGNSAVAGAGDVYRRDLTSGITIPVSVISTAPNTTGDGDSAPVLEPLRISDDGRYVAFASAAANLTGAADGNGALDVFVRDVDGASTTLMSATPAGGAGNAISSHVALSADGRHVAFVSQAMDLASATDTPGTDDVFARDLTATTATLISASAGGGQTQGGSEPSISDTGRYVAFSSTGTNLIAGLNDGNGGFDGGSDVFVRDMTAGALLLVSSTASATTTTADGASSQPWVSGDGRSVTFASRAQSLVAPFADHDGTGADLYWRGLKLDPAATITADATSGTAPLAITFSAASPNPAITIGYTWDFGDGASTGGASSVTHTFASAGTYTVTVKITDADGDTATAGLPVTVADPPGVQQPVVVPPDTTAPKLSLAGAKRAKLAKVLAHGLRGGVGTSENVTAHLTARISAPAARALGLGSVTTIGALKRPVAARVQTAYTIHLTAAARRQLAKRRKVRSIAVTITVTGADEAGNQAKSVSRTVTLSR